MSKTKKTRALFRLVAVLGRLEAWVANGKYCAWNCACRAAVESEESGGLDCFAVRAQAVPDTCPHCGEGLRVDHSGPCDDCGQSVYA